eukprot:TRINITY_DN14129_c0_g1_i1.p1 TRINITY_DN14129_c0_g1~~TRINITY_DN14129_c0_g1_i1.p1  ORF type:complete len:809 (+),score=183.63 TRINITY_DN14129_c0_g1_i1:64-2490(+)
MRKAGFRLAAVGIVVGSLCLQSEASGLPALFNQQCKEDLFRYVFCPWETNAYAFCTNKKLMNNTLVQALLNCSVDPSSATGYSDCYNKCLDSINELLNSTLNAPCPTDFQAMHYFGAQVDWLSIGEQVTHTQVPGATFFPFPNVKTTGGVVSLSIGQPEKCTQIPRAHYCVMQGALAAQPSKQQQSFAAAAGGGAGGLPLSFFFGLCLPNSCQQPDMEAAAIQLHNATAGALAVQIECNFLRPLANMTNTSAQISQFLGWGFSPVEYLNKIPLSSGAIAMIVVLALVLVLAVVGTGVQLQQEAKAEGAGVGLLAANNRVVVMDGGATSEPLQGPQEAPEPVRPSPLEKWLMHWSMLRNARSFLKTRKPEENTFAAFDCIRVFSMCQVILGHSFVYAMSTANFSNLEQFLPPNGLIGQARFMFIPGCFYGVDSFFLMSGFLCAYSMERKIFSKPEATKPKNFSLMYFKFVLFRYLRLIPLEMFCIGIATLILPFLGKGIVWSMDRGDGAHCSDAAGGAQCATYWWTNALFIQNLNQYLGKCMGHTWYLAADFQIYLTAPFFSLAYALDRRAGWSVLALGLTAGIAIPMIMLKEYQFVPDTLLGGQDFSQEIYMKPWTRMAPFVIGIGTAWLWSERFSKNSGRHETTLGAVGSVVLSLVALGLMAAATFLRIVFYKCDGAACTNIQTNPAGPVFSYLWIGFSIPCWALGLAILSTLCFQRRFLPVVQNVMHAAFWQPIAKLTYAAYLIHTCVLILDFCQRNDMIDFTGASYLYGFIAYVVFTMFLAFVLWLLFEKPCANMQMALLGGGGD